MFRDTKGLYLGTPSSSFNCFSPNIWKGVPSPEDCALDPRYRQYYITDWVQNMPRFHALDGDADHAVLDHRYTVATGGSVGIDSDENVLTLTGHTSADQGVQFQAMQAPFVGAAGNNIYFEARVRLSSIAGKNQIAIGLASVDTTIFAAGAITAAERAMWLQDVNTTAGSIEFSSADGGSEDTNAYTGLLAADTWVNLGFVMTGITSIQPYCNNVAKTEVTDAADISDGVAMYPSAASLMEGTASVILGIDWIRCVQYVG